MNYDFHVGDYVETAGGSIGYIDHTNDYISWHCTKCDIWFAAGFSYSVISKETGMPMTHFARIGKYDLTKKESKKIKKLSSSVYSSNINHCKIVEKINELVDWVNEHMEDSQ